MDPLSIIEKHYKKNSKAYNILLTHSRLVTEKAVNIAEHINEPADKNFIYEASMLHDIGMIFTHAPDIGCYGNHPYITHGILGKKLLEEEGLFDHAAVAERHTGTGITKEEIQEKNLPLPLRDMIPVTVEQEIICYADKFFSKDPEKLLYEKPAEAVAEAMEKYGKSHLEKFREWHLRFNV